MSLVSCVRRVVSAASRANHNRRAQGAAILSLAALLVLSVLPAWAATPVAAHFLGSIQTVGGGYVAPLGVAVDSAGNIYVADENHNAVGEVPVSCLQGADDSSCMKTVGSGFSRPVGVVVDSAGNVYVADAVSSDVKEIPASCISGANNSTCVKTLGGGFSEPYGVAVNSAGNVYVADFDS